MSLSDPLGMSVVALWELAHPDGSSIFVRHASSEDMETATIFGPFLFLTQEDMQKAHKTSGPMNLLRAMGNIPVRGQQISLPWIVEHTSNGFANVTRHSDCIVIGSEGMLVPLTRNGAVFADTRLNGEQRPNPATTPWTDAAEHWGPNAFRLIIAAFIQALAEPGEPN